VGKLESIRKKLQRAFSKGEKNNSMGAQCCKGDQYAKEVEAVIPAARHKVCHSTIVAVAVAIAEHLSMAIRTRNVST
jgi:hypothetical protein